MLDRRPARQDLTDRECTKFMAGTIGVLLQMSDAESVKRAVAFTLENFDAIAEPMRVLEGLPKA